MGKSILVMDTPKTCDKCPLFHINDGKRLEALCTDVIEMKRKLIGPYKPSGVVKPDWCQLKDVPEKKGGIRGNLPEYDTDNHYEIGWNDCIDQILNGGQRNE